MFNFRFTEFSEVHIQHRTQLAPYSHPRLLTSEAGAPSIAADHKTSEPTSVNAVERPA
jgi:hypothetical protein